jgi:hypothetical protein
MKFRTALVICCVALLQTGSLRAEFVANAQSAVFDPVSRNVTFSLTFNHEPDFYTADAVGRAATDFQYFVYGDPTAAYPAEFDSIIRGGEIYRGSGLPVRNASPSVADPDAGGWGSIRALVPFTVSGANLTFSVPLTRLSDHSTDGHFTYILQTDVYGALNQRVTGQSVVASPEPSALSLLCVVLTLALLGAQRRRA